LISYESVACIVRQCEKTKELNSIKSIHSHGVFQGRRMTPAELQARKNTTKCRRANCGKYGHWYKDHYPNGSLKPGVKSYDTPQNGTNGSVCYGNQRGTSSSNGKVSFNMVNLRQKSLELHNPIGPLLDDGAPYSGIGLDEFKLLQSIVYPSWNGKFDGLPSTVKNRPFWQYGVGSHSSKSRRIIGSVMLTAKTDEGNEIDIRHLVIEGSSQWIIGRNVTQLCNIVRIGKNMLELPNNSGSISLRNYDLHCYVPYEIFCSQSSFERGNMATMFCAAAKLDTFEDIRPWKDVKSIVDKVHKHVCGHSNYSDMRILLERNNLWNKEVEKYLPLVLERCSNCHTTALPKNSRKVSLSSMSREFNNVVSVDHMFLGENCVFHIMDTKSRYSVGAIVESTTMAQAIEVFESTWLSEFWAPDVVAFDQAFDSKLFDQFLQKYGIGKRALPARRHSKNVIESKHRIIRDVYLRLKSSFENDETVSESVLVKQAIRVTNDLYGNDVASAYELAKGYTRPVARGSFPMCVPKEVLEAQENLKAKRKLTLILRSKSVADEEFKPGSIVQVYVKKGNEKRGQWSTNRIVLEFNPESRMVVVPGANGKLIHAAMEDVRAALPEDGFAKTVQDSIDVLDRGLEDVISNTITNGIEDDFSSKKDSNVLSDEEDNLLGEILPVPSVGDKIEVYWEDDNKFYPGTVATFTPNTGDIQIYYDDGDIEALKIQEETWRFPSQESVVANGVELAPGMNLPSIEKEVIGNYYEAFGSKEFLSHHAQGLPSFVLQNAYKEEEQSFTNTVRKVHVTRVPIGSNVISSHVLYKVKMLDDGTKMLKARIAPHGNKDRERDNLKTDSATCSPVGMRLILSIAVIKKWNLAKIDFKSAFLQSGQAIRDVYVKPPRESKEKFVYWLLLTAAYGLVNASAKWQEEIDGSLKILGFHQLIYVPQLFYKRDSSGLLSVIAVKVVDDVLLAGNNQVIRKVVEEIQKRYTIGTIVYSPGSFLFNGLSISQDEDYNICVDADAKLSALQPIPLSRFRRKAFEEKANAVELSAFRSSAGSIGWIGVSASPFCALASSSLQQKVPDLKVKDLVHAINHLHMLKKLGTVIKYCRPEKRGEYEISVVVFSDANRSNSSGQLGFIAGLVIGDFKKDSPFHAFAWASRKSKRPVRSIGSAETIAAGIAIDEGKILALSVLELLNVEAKLRICVDSKDLWDSLTTCHEPTDKSVKSDVNVIRYEFETKHVSYMTWIPGRINPADVLTKKDSPMVDPLQLMLFSGKLPIDFSAGKTRDSTQSTG